MISDDTVAASLISGVLSAIELIGLDVSAYLYSAAIDEAALVSPISRVDFSIFAGLLSSIHEIERNDAIGLSIGRELALSSYNALGYAVETGNTLYDALQLLPKYESLVVTSARTEIVDLEEKVEVHWSIIGGQHQAFLEDIFFASWVTLGKLLTGSDELTTAVHFTHSAPGNLDFWHETLGPNLLFHQTTAKVICSKNSLALPILQSDPFVHQVMTAKADDLTALINKPGVAKKVAYWLRKMLPEREADQRTLACHLNMSERTLRRHLQQERTSYQEILDNVRKDRATYYLVQTSLSIPEIATLLGYQHLTSFNAAYKRWTGNTPGSIRS